MVNQELLNEFRIVKNHVILLAIEWKFYNDLYSNQESVNLLNKSASFFYSRLQIILIDSIVLKIAKLLDKKETGRNGSNKNLTIDYLISQVGDNLNLSDKRNFIIKEFDKLKDYRNKNIAHIDMSTQLSNVNHLPKDSYEILLNVLQNIYEFMNEIQVILEDSNTAYEHIMFEKGTNSLLTDLMRAIRYKELLENEEIDPLDFIKNSERLKNE